MRKICRRDCYKRTGCQKKTVYVKSCELAGELKIIIAIEFVFRNDVTGSNL